jgi:inorganic phosphate transporter, PiT family
MLIATALLAFYLACNLGANDVANAMGTSVGSKAITLRQALIIAGLLEFAGAVLCGQRVTATLTTQIVQPEWFAAVPQTLLLGMVAVLLACGLWLNGATALGLPVSSSHAVVGAIAGVGWATVGWQAVDWPLLGSICLTWLVTPLVSGAIAAIGYTLVQRAIFAQPRPQQALQEWLPWLSALFVLSLGGMVLPQLHQSLVGWLPFLDGWHGSTPAGLLLGAAIATLAVTLVAWQPTGQQAFARLQVLSACCVAFAHGSNDVGNAVAPLAAISHLLQTHTVPTGLVTTPLWILALGGAGIVVGLAIWGSRVMATIGETITPLQPNAGFCAELATAMTVLLASQVGLPVSTSHALVGGVVGVGMARDRASVDGAVLRQVGSVWIATIPMAAGLAAAIVRLLLVAFP